MLPHIQSNKISVSETRLYLVLLFWSRNRFCRNLLWFSQRSWRNRRIGCMMATLLDNCFSSSFSRLFSTFSANKSSSPGVRGGRAPPDSSNWTPPLTLQYACCVAIAARSSSSRPSSERTTWPATTLLFLLTFSTSLLGSFWGIFELLIMGNDRRWHWNFGMSGEMFNWDQIDFQNVNIDLD